MSHNTNTNIINPKLYTNNTQQTKLISPFAKRTHMTPECMQWGNIYFHWMVLCDETTSIENDDDVGLCGKHHIKPKQVVFTLDVVFTNICWWLVYFFLPNQTIRQYVRDWWGGGNKCKYTQTERIKYKRLVQHSNSLISSIRWNTKSPLYL